MKDFFGSDLVHPSNYDSKKKREQRMTTQQRKQARINEKVFREFDDIRSTGSNDNYCDEKLSLSEIIQRHQARQS